MKDGWEVRPVGEIADHVLGKMLDKSKNTGTPRPYLRNLNVRWFDFDLSDMLEMKFEDHEFDRYTARRGDVLICEGGYPGRAAIWDSDEPIHFQKAVHRVRFDEQDRGKWLVYYLTYMDQNGGLRDHFSGTGIQHFTGKALGRFPIPLPPLEEQRRIVAVLDEAFEGLARARVNIEANLADAGELRVKAIAAVMGDQEETSPNLLLKEIALDFGRGKSKHRPRNDPRLYGGEYPFIQTGDVRAADRYIRSHSQTYNDTGLAQSKLWPAGTVCVTIAANIAETATLTYPACFPDSVIGIVPKNETAIAEYIEYVLQYARVRLQARGRGAAQDNINLKTFETELFPFPPLAEQESVVRQLDEVHDHVGRVIEEGREQLIDLDALRQSLLASAFRGELT